MHLIQDSASSLIFATWWREPYVERYNISVDEKVRSTSELLVKATVWLQYHQRKDKNAER